MYLQFFGLQKDPFTMTPDPAFLLLTNGHREALAGLSYAVLGRKGFVVLTGNAGTGKTTLLMKLVRSVPPSRAQFSLILNPTLTPAEFLELALIDFGLTNIPSSKAQRLILLQKFLLSSHQEGRVSVLIVDEAHKLSADVLEEIRLLTNFELPEGKLIQIVLAGQEELQHLLNREDLRQLKQRVAVRLCVKPLSVLELEDYIRHRWNKAGAAQPPFTADALKRIGHWSRRIPRLVNVICDNALMLAYAEGVSVVTAEHIAEVAADLDLMEHTVRVNGETQPPRNGAQRNRASSKDATVSVPEPIVVPLLERYAMTRKPSRFMRLAAKFGMTQVRKEA